MAKQHGDLRERDPLTQNSEETEVSGAEWINKHFQVHRETLKEDHMEPLGGTAGGQSVSFRSDHLVLFHRAA